MYRTVETVKKELDQAKEKFENLTTEYETLANKRDGDPLGYLTSLVAQPYSAISPAQDAAQVLEIAKGDVEIAEAIILNYFE